MSKQYSYVKVLYGRNGGKTEVTRYLKVDPLGKVRYVENRVSNGNTTWKLGTVMFLNVVKNNMRSSTKKEFESNYKTALEEINS